ncbi:hypothetical protein CWR48_05910 [Oceanobacillus arenosus]|uniref:Zinc-finger domain-containing protein n=1 Tax=Oceanobacillus arenosus TaxID=1229153 RepID=A0A3D8PVT0_9BACI|nr:zf-HC2 domain-containing protein [Oceanobacillus arenosus]RDW20236.1 hypothetical protein CWR48_05910 [Oceanobacillus arenosus]
MKHIQYEEWLSYIEDTLDEKTREHYENHLYDCDACMSLYLEAIEAMEQKIPVMATNATFTDEVMQKISDDQKQESKVKTAKSSFYQKAIVHYVVAAAITLFLMSQGAFSQLMNVVTDFEASNKNETSIFTNMLDQSASIIDKFEMKTEKGEQ